MRLEKKQKVKIPGNTDVTRMDLLGPIRGIQFKATRIKVDTEMKKRYIPLYRCPRSLILHDGILI